MTAQTTATPGAFAIPSTAPVYIDGIPAASVTPASAGQPQQRFWSSQPRYAGDPTAEELTVSLGQPRYVNYVSLDLPHFPHAAYFWYWDGSGWQPLTTGGGAQLVIITSGSVPALVDSPAALGAGLNPYHYGAGHWVRYDERVLPVTTSKILVHLLRPAVTSGQQLPAGPSGQPVPYPLGVRNFDLGCRVTQRSDVPPTLRSPVTLTQRLPFTTSSDVNGSPVQVAVRENRAADLLQGGTWRSAPQPTADSVVNLYLDGRDAAGNPQLISSFYLQPVTSGVRLNLYYSALPPPASAVFAATDDPVAPGILAPGGVQPPLVTSQGISFGRSTGWLDLSNQAAGTNAAAPWWCALEAMPSFSSADTGTYVIADTGALRLSFSSGTWTVSVGTGGVLAQWSFAFSAADRLQFALGYDGSHLVAWSSRGGLAQSAATAAPASPVVRFGAPQGASPVLAGQYVLTSFILKQQALTLNGGVPADFTAFAAGASAYVTGSATSGNAVARFDPQWVLGTVCPWGFVGGLGASFAACDWVQVPRSYTLSAGYLDLDPTVASCWKFEFTALQPEPYDYLAPGTVSGQYFTPQSLPAPEQADPGTPAPLDAGLAVASSIAATFSLGDAPAPRADSPPAGTVLPTEALYAADPLSAARMAAAGGALYGFQQWQPPAAVGASAGPSAYQSQDVPVNGRVAYFAALSSLSMYAADYAQADDTAQYSETFAAFSTVDPSALSAAGWQLVPGYGLVTPSNLPPGGSAAQSLVLSSSHAVTGLQFATVQSNPVQLLDDSDFSDPSFASWGPVGDALPLYPSPESSQLGSMAQVTRNGVPSFTTPYSPGSWAYVEGEYSSWGVMESSVPAWIDLGLPAATSAYGGIGYTGTPVAVAGGGRVYAAARVFSPVALTAPLYVQLLDGATGTVIAEAEQPVAGNAVTEWFAGFTVGQPMVTTNTWSVVTTAYPSWASSTGLQWSSVDTTVTPLGQTVTARVIQKESTSDSWGVDNISVFDDAITWQFSNDGGASWYDAYDVRNNPRGAVLFPASAPGHGTQLMWRVSAYRAGLVVSGLSIRPWYQTWPRGIPPRAAGIGHGPNMSPADQYALVEADPRWSMTSGPVPDDWYFAVRQVLGVSAAPNDFPAGVPEPAAAEVGNGIAWEPPVPGASAQTWTDVYADVYTGTYALADGGQLYTGTYCDVYGDDEVTGPPAGTPGGFAAPGTARPGLFRPGYPAAPGTVSAPFSAAVALSATAAVVPLPRAALGADLGPVPASDASVAAWVTGTGQPLPARRITLGPVIPASLAASGAAGDAGVRRVLFDVRPDATTTPAQLGAFLASCKAGNLDASVSIWAGADTAFASPADWAALLPGYADAIRQAGYRHVLAVSNNAFTSGWLDAWYPGDDLVDVIAPSFYCQGPAPGSGSPNLAGAAAFADAHGKPLGLYLTGADHTAYSAAQCESFIAYLKQLFTGRADRAKPGYDLLWDATGSSSVLTAPPGVLAAWQDLARSLA